MNPSEFKDKLAKRLTYLWNLRDTNPHQYSARKLGIEKEEIYCAHGSDGTIALAQKYYSAKGNEFRLILNEGERYRYDAETNTLISR